METRQTLKNIGELFWTFFKIGAFTFGGGYAMIPLIHREAVEKHPWITSDDMMNMIAIAESTPGALAVNSATFVGCRVAGFWGALFATIGVVLPSLAIICVISLFYLQFLANKWVAWAFEGVRCAVVLLMVNAVVKLAKGGRLTAFHVVLSIAAFLAAAFTKFDTILIILISGIIGVIYALWCRYRSAEQGGR